MRRATLKNGAARSLLTAGMVNRGASFSTHGVVLFDDGARVLLAEDDASFRTTLALGLRRDGHDVVEAADGSEVLDALVGSLSETATLTAFDVIVSDVRMPGVQGLDLLRAVRGLPEPPPVILMTAFGTAEIHREARRLGAVTVLVKPFDMDDLRTAVAHALGLRPAAKHDIARRCRSPDSVGRRTT